MNNYPDNYTEPKERLNEQRLEWIAMFELEQNREDEDEIFDTDPFDELEPDQIEFLLNAELKTYQHP